MEQPFPRITIDSFKAEVIFIGLTEGTLIGVTPEGTGATHLVKSISTDGLTGKSSPVHPGEIFSITLPMGSRFTVLPVGNSCTVLRVENLYTGLLTELLSGEVGKA